MYNSNITLHSTELQYCIVYYLAYSKPTTKLLQNLVLPFVNDKWYRLGVELLDVEQEKELQSIESNHKYDMKNCCSKLFRYWLQTHSNANWDQLVKALRSPAVDLLVVAESVESRFTGKT